MHHTRQLDERRTRSAAGSISRSSRLFIHYWILLLVVVMSSEAAEQRAAAFQCVHPEQFYQRFISHGIRPDGRLLSSCRPMVIGTGEVNGAADGEAAAAGGAAGSATARCGSTSAIAAVTLSVGTPLDASPGRGDVDVQVSLGPLCDAARFAVGPQPREASALGALIKRVLVQGQVGGGKTDPDRSAASSSTADPAAAGATASASTSPVSAPFLDLSQLCISHGVAAWQLHLDVVIVAHDGAIADVALAACVGALQNTVLPAIDARALGTGDAPAGTGRDGSARQSGKVLIVAAESSADNDAMQIDGGSGRFASRALGVRAPPVALSFAVMSAAAATATGADAASSLHGDGQRAWDWDAERLELLADPTAEEEALACGSLTVVKDGAGRVLALSMPGSLALQETQIVHAIDQCDERVHAVTNAFHT